MGVEANLTVWSAAGAAIVYSILARGATGVAMRGIGMVMADVGDMDKKIHGPCARLL
jgi:hypothetical protein